MNSQEYYVETASLPFHFREALRICGHKREVTRVQLAERVHPPGTFASDNRAVRMLVSEHADGQWGLGPVQYGSWGGSNGFEGLPCDVSTLELPAGSLAVAGQDGSKPFCSLYATALVFESLRPKDGRVAGDALTQNEVNVLCTYAFYNSKGRQEYLKRNISGPLFELVKEMLAGDGLLTVNKAGAARCTAAGKTLAREVDERWSPRY